MLIIPDGKHIKDSLALAREFGLGFEYNDFTADMDDEAAVERRVETVLANRPPRPCTMHGAFRDIPVASADAQIRAVSQRRVKQSVTICRRLGARAVVFHTDTAPGMNSPAYTENWLLRNTIFYSELLEANRDVRIYIENMSDQTPELLQRLAQGLARHPNFGVCFDLAHASVTATPVEHWVGALAPYVRHCHLSDCDGQSDCRLPLGRGVLDFPRFFELLRRHRISASLVIEVAGVDIQRQSLAYLKSRGLANITEPDF